MKRSIVAFGVVMILLLHCVPKVHAYCETDNRYLIPVDENLNADFHDLDSSWCKDYVEICFKAGVLKGKTNTIFDEKSYLTNAQITVITARFYNYLTGEKYPLNPKEDEAWYVPAYELLKQIMPDVIQENMYLDAPLMPDISNNPCSRTAFVNMLVGVLETVGVELPIRNKVSAVPDELEPNVLMFYQAGILNGVNDYGFFKGQSTLTRGHTAAMLARLIDSNCRLEFKLQVFDFSKGILGLDKNTVLFSVNGEPVRSEEFSEYLCDFLLYETMAGGKEPELNTKPLIESYCAEIVSPLILVNEHKLSLTENEREIAKAYAKLLDGYRGFSAEYWYKQHCREQLVTKVQKEYGERDMMNHVYDADIKELCEGMEIVETPEIQKLDLKKILTAYLEYFG